MSVETDMDNETAQEEQTVPIEGEEQPYQEVNDSDEPSEHPSNVFDFPSGEPNRTVVDYRYSADDIFDDESDLVQSDAHHWSIPWSDLMMVMFVLFAALLTAQTLQKKQSDPVEVLTEKEVPGPDREKPPSFEPLMRVNVFERSKQAVRETNIKNVQIVSMEDQSVKVSVRGPMFFELGKADLRKDMRDFLVRLAKIINQTPYQVNVIGHTDDNPIKTSQFPSNWELSVTRAARAVRYLIDEGGVSPKRFTVMGRSHYEPVSSGTAADDKAKNRRVEIIITREVDDRNPGDEL